MKAFVLTKYGEAESAFQLKTIEDVHAKSGQVRIKTEGFGLNFADVMARRGLYRDAPPLPCVIGYDAVGIIDEIGEGVPTNYLGKRVLALTRFGAYAEFAVTDFRACVEIPADLSVTKACALATQYSTAYFSAIEKANIQEGEIILIHAAAGGVGTALIQLAKWKKCQVIALTGSDEKINYLKNLGADIIINYKKKDYEQEIKSQLKGESVDVSFNSVAGSTFKKDMRLLGVNGRIILYGLAERSGKKFGFLSTLRVVLRMGRIIPVFLMMKTKSVAGVNMLVLADHKPLVLQRCLEQVMALYRQKALDPQVGKEFNVNEFAQAHALLESGKSVGKLAVKW